VEPQPPIDREALARWMDANGVPGAGELPELASLEGGSQNELTRIERFGDIVPELIRKAASLAAMLP
jgi:hypothetical protein